MVEIGPKSRFFGSSLYPKILPNEKPYKDIYLGQVSSV